MLRQVGRELAPAEIQGKDVQEAYRAHARNHAPRPGRGPGGAADRALRSQLAVLEDRPENIEEMEPGEAARKEREAARSASTCSRTGASGRRPDERAMLRGLPERVGVRERGAAGARRAASTR